MYRKSSKGWAKHLDFILLDLFCLQAAYFIYHLMRYQSLFLLESYLYRNMIFVFCFCQLSVTFFNESFKNVIRRSFVQELGASFQHVLLIMLLSIFYLFSIQEGGKYSRIAMGFTGVLYFLLTCVLRGLWKKFLEKRGAGSKSGRSLLVLAAEETAGDMIENLKTNNYSGLQLVGIALMEKDGEAKIGKEIAGVPVVAGPVSAADYICREWVDEVFLSLPRKLPFPEELYHELMEMGITVHLHIQRAVKLEGQMQNLGKMGTYVVLSSSINMITIQQAACKRFLDILGGFVGCLVTAVLFLVIAPAVYIQSPGPVFFSQERVGKNGKKFRLYKFRSTDLDAEERKNGRMDQNTVPDARTFKVKKDPRMIGGEKGIGGFIRKYSIDEFPQFWNVLKGDMSLVGTRPPTPQEWEKYDLHHRIRLAAKPGITGPWQVSGRSRAADFEQAAKLDKQYITEWNIALDIRILLKTVRVVVRGDGAC